MKNWIKYCQAAPNRRFLVGLAAVAMVLSLAAYEFDNPVRAAAPAAAAAPLDDNSVSALLSLDRAMEALAARVTPAIVNVTVTSKRSGDVSGPGNSGDNDATTTAPTTTTTPTACSSSLAPSGDSSVASLATI